MDILTPLQKDFLHRFSESPFRDSFFLTGGTALAAFYLYHRLSEDLDFFTESPMQAASLISWVEETSRSLGLHAEIRRHSQSFVGCFLKAPDGELLKVDFAQDSPFRFEKLQFEEQYKINIDNLTDIACNKLSALYDRADAKDFIDVYFLDREFLPFEEILAKTRKKHAGLDDYWMAQALHRVEFVQKLPRMLKNVDFAALKNFFNEKAKHLLPE